jgi:hypothetical protein
MKTRFTLLFFCIAGIVSFSNVAAQHGNGHAPLSAAAVELKMDMRKLWEDHITWTRNVIFNIIDELPGTNEAVARLLQNQVDIGNAIKPYYGAAAGDQLTALLTSHILIAADLLNALDDGDAAALSAANAAWFANADSIALFLSTANPNNWSFQATQDMMYDHLNFTTAEAVARKNADYPGDVIAYDNVHNEILEMADFLSEGIINQFPSMFHGNNRLYIQLSDGVLLNQNAPNPFTEETEITYFISENVANAQMLFYNAAGKLIKSVPIETRGDGSVVISASNLQSGVYSYSIMADGKLVETKQMVK